jgi:hypothetical protein
MEWHRRQAVRRNVKPPTLALQVDATWFQSERSWFAGVLFFEKLNGRLAGDSRPDA